MSASNWVHVNVAEILRESDQAILILMAGDGRELWIPLSVIADANDYSVGDRNCSISVQEWFANKNNIEGDD